MSNWIFHGAIIALTSKELIPLTGFIYEIEKVSTGRRYTGKKRFHSMRTVSGEKRPQRRESGWRTYASSQKALPSAYRATPTGYRRTIIHLCKTAGEMTYRETSELLKRDAIV